MHLGRDVCTWGSEGGGDAPGGGPTWGCEFCCESPGALTPPCAGYRSTLAGMALSDAQCEKMGVPAELYHRVVEWRRVLHRQPELAFKELQTAAFIRKELTKMEGVDVLDDEAGGTGVVAIITGIERKGSRTVLFRADMDALPVQEAPLSSGVDRPDGAGCCAACGSWPPLPHSAGVTQPVAALEAQEKDPPARVQQFSAPPVAAREKPATSEVEGVSHACGHDGHCAMLLGAAQLLAKRRSELIGRVVLIFQPAEERHPLHNPMGGAIRMIRDRAAGRALAARLGVTKFATRMERCEVADLSDRERNETDGFDTSMDGMFLEGIDEVYGAHLWNYAPAGTVGCLPGAITANSDSVSLTVRGTGGHASAPQGTVDAIAVAAQLVSALQMVVSRNVAPTESAVLTLGRIEGGFAPNVLANEVKVLGTMRTFTAPVKALMVRRIHQIAMGIAVSHGPACSIDVDIREGYPACVNDARCAKAVLEAAASVLPGQHVGPPMPNMAGEVRPSRHASAPEAQAWGFLRVVKGLGEKGRLADGDPRAVHVLAVAPPL